MVSNYIFPSESATCSKNVTLTPLTTFSTVGGFSSVSSPYSKAIVIPNAPKAGEGPYDRRAASLSQTGQPQRYAL